MSNHPSLIRLTRLSKTYRTGVVALDALKDVDLSIAAGEFLAIMGPSGSGKSTLMNIIGCLDTPSCGSYMLDGVEVANLDDDQLANLRSSKIGFVFQSFNLLPRTSALENVELPCLYNWRSVAHRHEFALERLREVGLEERAMNTPTELSGGQQQRVAIARALVNDPEILLADEPTGALDTRSGEEIMAILQRLNRQGKTIVMVTHEPDIAQHAKRIVRFRDGHLFSDESVEAPLDAKAVLMAQATPVAKPAPV